MANLRDIRNRIESVQNTQKITRAMKMVASAKLRKAQNRIIATRPYARKMREVVGRLVRSAEGDNVLLRKPATTERILFIVIGSDRGLCGAFNNNLFKVVQSKVEANFKRYLRQKKLSLYTIGKKPTEYFKRRKYPIDQSYSGFFDDLAYHTTCNIMENVVEEFVRGNYDAVYMAYNEFVTALTQKRRVQKLLPIDPGKLNGEPQKKEKSLATIDYIYEPQAGNILDHILPKHLNMQLWKAVLNSNAAEQGARMTAMDNATENANELQEELRLEYNQARQEAITTEISEIVSGAEALRET